MRDPKTQKSFGHAFLFSAEQGNQVKFLDTWERNSSFSSCDYKVPFLCRAFCIRRKPVIGRAVVARREGEMSALMQLKKRLHLNVKVRRPTNSDLKMKRAGSRKKGRWRKLSAYISYVTKAMVSQSSFFYYSKTFHP